jgi:Protein of unknown function (DUF1439)
MPERLPSPPRRFLLRAVLAAAASPVPFEALAGFNFFTSVYTASREELQAQIGKHFPLERRYAEIFTVGLHDPQLTLDSRSNRAAVTVALSIASPLLRPPQVNGAVTISSALKYDPTARAILLDQPQAERIDIQGLHGQDAQRLQQIGAAVAQELLRDQPLHTFTAQDLTVGRKTYEIGDISVQDDGITVQLK